MGCDMKKIVACLFVLLPFCVFATDMCARDDTMIMILDPLIPDRPKGEFNSVEWRWGVNFPFGRVSGDATCLSESEGGATALLSTLDADIETGQHGMDSDGNERKYCWCRISHPFGTKWYLNMVYASADVCKTVCVRTDSSGCASNLIFDSTFRHNVFDLIGR